MTEAGDAASTIVAARSTSSSTTRSTRRRSATSTSRARRVSRAPTAPSRSPAGRSTTSDVDHIDFLVDGQIVAGAVGAESPPRRSTGARARRPGRVPGRSELARTPASSPTSTRRGSSTASTSSRSRRRTPRAPSRELGPHRPDHQQRPEPRRRSGRSTSRSTRPRSSASSAVGRASRRPARPRSAAPSLIQLRRRLGPRRRLGAGPRSGRPTSSSCSTARSSPTRGPTASRSDGALTNCYGINRPDVARLYSGYVNADNAGFNFSFFLVRNDGDRRTDRRSCSPGPRADLPGARRLHDAPASTRSRSGPATRRRRSRSSARCPSTSSATPDAGDQPAFGYIDTPSNYQFINGHLRGLRLGLRLPGRRGVEVDVDGQVVGTADLRPLPAGRAGQRPRASPTPFVGFSFLARHDAALRLAARPGHLRHRPRRKPDRDRPPQVRRRQQRRRPHAVSQNTRGSPRETIAPPKGGAFFWASASWGPLDGRTALGGADVRIVSSTPSATRAGPRQRRYRFGNPSGSDASSDPWTISSTPCPISTGGSRTLEARLGVRAAPGGRHPGRGERNALHRAGARLLPRDPRARSEPAGADRPLWLGLEGLSEPRLTAWAITALGSRRPAGPSPGARGVRLGPGRGGAAGSRPDGTLLSWEFTDPHAVVAEGLVPFLHRLGRLDASRAASAPGGVSLLGPARRAPASRRSARAAPRASTLTAPRHQGPPRGPHRGLRDAARRSSSCGERLR